MPYVGLIAEHGLILESKVLEGNVGSYLDQQTMFRFQQAMKS